MLRSSSGLALATALAFTGCASEFSPEQLSVAPADAAQRELQGRRYDGIGEKELLDAATGVLQDLGFTIESSGAPLGFVQGSKERDAKAPDQVLALTIMMALAASQGAAVPNMPVRQDQTISVLVSVRPARADDAASHVVMVTFHQHVRQPLQNVAGPLRDPELYRTFFELLSKAIFIEGHKL